MTTDAAGKLLEAILAALPAAALAVLFAIFAVVITVIFMRALERQSANFVQALHEDNANWRSDTVSERSRWREDVEQINTQWREAVSSGFQRFSTEMALQNAGQAGILEALRSHDKTSQLAAQAITSALHELRTDSAIDRGKRLP